MIGDALVTGSGDASGARASLGVCCSDPYTSADEIWASPFVGQHATNECALPCFDRCPVPWAHLFSDIGAERDWLGELNRDVNSLLNLDLAEISRAALVGLVPLRCNAVKGLQFFVDGTGGSKGGSGSSSGAQGLHKEDESGDAAWAVVVLAIHADSSRAFVGAAGGKWATVREAWLAAGLPGHECKQTSHFAEGFAMFWPMFWAVQLERSGQLGRGLDMDFVSDSSISRSLAEGQTTARTEVTVGHGCRSMLLWLRRLGSAGPAIHMRHVPSHVGHPFNEVVDCLAAVVGRDGLQEVTVRQDMLRAMAGDAGAWLWLKDAPACVAIQYPPTFQEHFQVTMPNASTMDRLQLVEGQHVTGSSEDSVEQLVSISLRVASANVLSVSCRRRRDYLESGTKITGRVAALAQQFCQAGFHVVGVQESRTQAAATWRTHG